MNKRAYTLIELLIAVIIIGIAFYSLVKVFSAVMPKNMHTESIVKAAYLSNRVMEETIAKTFTTVSSAPATSFNAPFSQFKYQVIVNYVTTNEPDVVSASPTNFKRIKVRVWEPLAGTIEVVTLITTYEL